MDLDYILVYAGLITILILSLVMVKPPTPSHNLKEFITILIIAGEHPGSSIQVRLVLPKGIDVEASGKKLTVKGAEPPRIESSIVEGFDGNTVIFKVELGDWLLLGGYIYTLKIHSKPGKIIVEKLFSTKIS